MKPKKYPSTARAAGHALLACIVLVSALIPPLRAFAVSTWNPTLIVNTESFQQIDSGDGTTTVDLRFGTSSSTLTLLTTGKFRFNKSLSVQGGLSGSYLTIDQQANISGSLVVRRNVGIGTSSPQAPLHVSGSTIIFGPGENSTPNSVTVRGPAAAGSNTVGGSFTFDASNGTGNGGSGPFIFRTAPSAGGSGIAFDAASTTGGLSANSASWNHTTGAGSNRILIVGTSMYKFGVGAYSVTSLTYGGQALTKIRSDSSAGRTFTELWYLLDPPVGTASISLTYNQPYAGAMTAGAITLTGVDASPIDAQNGTAAASVNVTTATANAWVVDTIATEGVSGFSVGAGQTSRWNAQYGAASTEGPVASPGAVTMSWSGVSGDTAISAVAIKPLSNASANTLTERLRITPDGNVGIGKSVPTQKFDVVGTISGSRLSISNNANISGSLVIKNNLSGSALFSFGLGSCSNTTTSKLIYNSSTGKFSCGTDQNNPPWSNTGSLRAAFDTRYIKKSGDTMTGALKITKQNGYYTGALLNVLGTMSGRSLFITGSGGSASPLISANSGNGRVGIGKHIPTSAFDVVGTISGSRLSISNNANISGSLVIKNNLSGSALFSFGLGNCNNATTSKLLYNPSTGKFSCGTDQSASPGSGLTYSDASGIFVKKSGDTMTGALKINITQTQNQTGALTIHQKTHATGALIDSDTTKEAALAIDIIGTSVAPHMLFGYQGTFDTNLYRSAANTLRTNDSFIADGDLTFGDTLADLITVNAASWTFANDTNFALSGGVNGLSFDTTTFSVDATNDRIGIGTIAPKTTLDVVGTISGSRLKLSNLVQSGGILFSSGSTVQATAKGSTGQLLVSRGTGTPEWKSPTGSMVWYFNGTLEVGASQGAVITMPYGLTLTSISLRVKGAPTGAAVIVDINENGSTIFSTRPQINAGATSGGGSAVFSDTTFAEGSEVTLDIDQIGSTFAGSGMTIMLNGVRRY